MGVSLLPDWASAAWQPAEHSELQDRTSGTEWNNDWRLAPMVCVASQILDV